MTLRARLLQRTARFIDGSLPGNGDEAIDSNFLQALIRHHVR